MTQSPEDVPVDAEIVESGAEVALPTTPVESTVLGTDYTEGGVPTFDYVRDQIEGRIATSIGTAELTGDTPAAASVDEQFAARERAGKDRLEQIRRAMREE
jgi:phage shock protein A